ncbi:MFS transporter [Solimonas marina]|uniref:Major facilitator superfamily domain-containing protein 7 n=1 Tax=Solimonas marina TaxID=2714601 RepID=A0A969WDK8_9GAMM|nr:MFS transporter [Solimonas marina]NKF24259.1 major facilitator superfamily domain-containing protein 7 [Solimonas marina]
MKGAALRVLLIYSAFNALMQFEWLRFAPITNATAEQYSVTVGAVGWLSLAFPLLFLPLALPAGALIDRWPVRRSLRAVALIMLVGCVLRVAVPGFTGLLIGQLAIAVAQPVVMALIARLARVWFPPEQHLQATSIGTLALFVGLALAFVVLPPTASLSIASAQRVDVLVMLVFAVACFVLVPADPAHDDTAGTAVAPKAARVLLQPALLVLFALIFLGNGYFNAIFTWLEPMLGASGIDAEHAGYVALAMLAGGVAGMAIVPAIATLRTHLRPTIATAALLSVPLTMLLTHGRSTGLLCGVGVILGAMMLAPLPLLVDTTADLAGEAHAGLAVSTFWLAGNAGAAAIIYGFSQLADRSLWDWAGIALSLLLAGEAVLTIGLRPRR